MLIDNEFIKILSVQAKEFPRLRQNFDLLDAEYPFIGYGSSHSSA